MRAWVFAVLAVLPCILELAEAGALPRIAIIIDDLGYQQAAGERAIALPGPIACAILPGSPRATALAHAAREQGKEILLHLPMQAANYHGKSESGSLTVDMTHGELAESFNSALLTVPYAIGVNNHQGSLLTRHPGNMRWLMDEISLHAPMFFVDSFTTHESVAVQIANEAGVRAVKRDVFLDSDPSPERVRQEFERLKALARLHGSAVAIGHPHDVTLALLEELLPQLREQGFALVPVSELVAN
ncbi:MAG TPA: divergent polysaccharide deacetylase family protein [Woeseiaceae bacterium]|nr:divergent polysaccharide deacetylase family protein [Woeseiaceae bacterium]